MNEKMIMRAAGIYRQWMITEAKKMPHYSNVVNNIDSVIEKSNEIKKWMTKFVRGMSPRFQSSSYSPKTISEGIVTPSVYKDIATHMIPDIGEDITVTIRYAINMVKSMVEPGKNAVTPLSLREACEEIRIITKAWPNVAYKGGTLSVLVKNIVLEDDTQEVDLGNFRIKLNLNNPLEGLSIHLQSEVTSEGGYCHPHMSGNNLCTGDGGLPMKDALCQGRLEDYFRIVEAILRTYNDTSPYESLTEWYDPQHENQFFCESCDAWRPDESGCYCSGCDYNYCETCDTGGDCCKDCENWRCGECSTCCNCCEGTICRNCINTCIACSKSVCENCFTMCNVCKESLCSECCPESCPSCGDTMCESCISTCGCCGDNHCSDCVDVKCNECSEDICKDCQNNCDGCDMVICETCGDNKCKDCGYSMCKSCVEKHNCLLSEVKSS